MTWRGHGNDSGRWPLTAPVWTILAGLLAGLVGGATTVYEYRTLSPLPQLYLLRYARSAVLADLHLPATRYQLLEVVTPVGRMLATEADLARVDLRWTNDRHDNAVVRDQFSGRIYGGETAGEVIIDLLLVPLSAVALVLCVGLPLALLKDGRRRRAIRDGVRLRGREQVEAGEFNARTPADGLEIRLGSGVRRRW